MTRESAMVAPPEPGSRPGSVGAMRAGDVVPEPKRRAPATAAVGRPHRRNAARPTPDARAAAAYQHATHAHRPHRPTWRCASCGDAWPCQPAREQLTEAVHPVQLAIIMTTRLAEAAGDLPTLEPGELWERFVAWTRRPGPRP